jgi:very-short-patch-repair endonuclease
VVSRAQLRRLGIGDAAIDRGIATGRLYPVFRGALAVGHLPAGRHSRLMAAVLACGEGSVVSHGTAAALLGLWERPPDLIDVIAPVQAGRQIGGVFRRHTPAPLPGEKVTHEDIPCTSPSRTIVDLAGMRGEWRLRRAIEQAAVLNVLDLPAIDAILRGPRRRGSPLLRSVLEDWRGHSPTTRLRSVLEAKLVPMLSARGLPAPQWNEVLMVAGERFEVDCVWRRRMAVVEADGGRYHDNPAARGRDAHRDRALAAAGYRVLRIRWDDLEEKPEATMAKIARLLGAA